MLSSARADQPRGRLIFIRFALTSVATNTRWASLAHIADDICSDSLALITSSLCLHTQLAALFLFLQPTTPFFFNRLIQRHFADMRAGLVALALAMAIMPIRKTVAVTFGWIFADLLLSASLLHKHSLHRLLPCGRRLLVLWLIHQLRL